MPKQLQIVLFCFATTMLTFFETCNTSLERCFQDHLNNILQVLKFQNFQLVKRKKICNRLATTEQAGQKNCNGKTTMFSTNALPLTLVEVKHSKSCEFAVLLNGRLCHTGNVKWKLIRAMAAITISSCGFTTRSSQNSQRMNSID